MGDGVLSNPHHTTRFPPKPNQIEHDWRALPSSSSPSEPPSLIHARLGGLYPIPSLLNHACVANACRVVLPDGTMLVRATQPLAAGEELRWPYAPPVKASGVVASWGKGDCR